MSPLKKKQKAVAAYEKYVSGKELILYLAAIFLYTNMTGMVGNYRNTYLVNVLQLESGTVSLYNTICNIAGFVLSFLTALYIDTKKDKGKGRFKPLALYTAIPCGLFIILSFVTPKGLSGTLLMVYLVFINIMQSQMGRFSNAINMLGVVMSPESKERDTILSYRGISSAIGNSAPLVVVLVAGIFIKNEGAMYIISAAACAVTGSVAMLLGLKIVNERTVYSEKRVNPLVGMTDVLRNHSARVIILSEFLKSFRSIATYMGTFLAVALLGGADKYIFLGLPTGIGTFVGMLIIKFLLKSFTSKILYIFSGIYSVIANIGAFAVGYVFFAHPDSVVLKVLFFFFLFLIGLQFGASNLLPSIFQADILEELELDTGKRLDASLPFVLGLGSTISGTIANALAPKILYGAKSIIHYIPPITDPVTNQTIYQAQTQQTKVSMLFFYTVFHGIMMLLAGLPFLMYRLTGERKEKIHEAVIAQRELIAQANQAAQE